MTTKRCTSRNRVAIDYVNYYPLRGGHAIDAELIYETFEPDEEDAGSTYGFAICARCDQWVAVRLANNIECDGDTTPYVPGDPKHWRQLNNLADL